MDSKPVLLCESLAALRLNHGENGTEVLEKNQVAVPKYPLQITDGMTFNPAWSFSV
jgi:hypothetical protein